MIQEYENYISKTASIVTDKSQSERSASGYRYEHEVFSMIPLSVLHNSGISAYLGRELVSLERRDIRKQIVVAPTMNGGFVGDVDILLYDEIKKQPILIVSTKTSIRERMYQVLCTKTMYQQMYPNIQVWFVTKNIGNEFGSNDRPKHPRKLVHYYNIPCYIGSGSDETDSIIKDVLEFPVDIVKVFCK